MTDITTKCPFCNQMFNISEEWIGKELSCPGCGNAFTIMEEQSVGQTDETAVPEGIKGVLPGDTGTDRKKGLGGKFALHTDKLSNSTNTPQKDDINKVNVSYIRSSRFILIGVIALLVGIIAMNIQFGIYLVMENKAGKENEKRISQINQRLDSNISEIRNINKKMDTSISEICNANKRLDLLGHQIMRTAKRDKIADCKFYEYSCEHSGLSEGLLKSYLNLGYEPSSFLSIDGTHAGVVLLVKYETK